MKTTDIIFSHSADEFTLEDLQSAVCAAAKADGRFNTGGDNNSFCPWCVNILRDEDVDSWSAVIQGCDGKMYEVPFTISEDNGSITLGTSAIPVNRKTTYVAAKDGKIFFYNGEVVKAGGTGSGRKPTTVESEYKNAKKIGFSAQTNGIYKEADSDADRASAHADKASSLTASKSEHALAYRAHSEAADAHEAASTRTDNEDEKQSSLSKAANERFKASQHLMKASDKSMKTSIKAAGTTDGASKGHAAKKSTMANDASADAHEASQTAHESDDADDHNTAKDAHETASDAHKKAMLAHAKVGNEEDASDHAKMMAAHDACADAHCRSDSEAVEASLKTLGFAIRAKKPEVLKCRASGTQINPSKAWKQGEEVMFMYMPGGISTITAGFRNKAINITVEVDEDTANTVQASFDNLKSDAPKQKPFGDIEHKEEEASIHPTRFEWGTYDDTDGILVAAEPTALGERNVNGKIHRSWSPSFTTDADYSKAKEKGGVYTFPEGVRGSAKNPARITGIDFCIGTLTNKPAFQNMPPVKAKHGGQTNNGKLTVADVMKTVAPPLQTKKIMSIKDVFRQLAGKIVKAADEQSDADKKSDMAKDLSKQATEASNDAMQSNDKSDHDDAAKLHEKASKAHAAAMIAHAKEGDKEKADGHAKMMNVHDAVADAHCKEDDDAVAASLKRFDKPTLSIETVFAQLRNSGSPQPATK